MNLQEAQQVMDGRGCDYFDHVSDSMMQWHDQLTHSELNRYTFLADNVAINELEHGTAIKKWDKVTVLSWFQVKELI